MTQIARRRFPSWGFVFLLAMILGAGLVLSGCGDDDTATTPAPAPAPPPAPDPEPEPEPEPEAPATPTGLHVDETTETSIEYHWTAVEGATGYVVQISMNETFGDEDDVIAFTAESHYTVMGLAPDTTVYVRVAAAVGTSVEDALVSGWTTHVTGMSNAPPPPPPPPPPDPVMVTFSLSDDADDPHFLVADNDDDEATAMATVNSEIMVESNTTAIITPMFVDDATGVEVDAMAGNMPFAYVSWGLMQSMALSDGATFMVTRTTMGANQEMEPTGDVAYVTCGPFNCADGMDAPELSIADSGVCTGWDPSVEFQVGKVKNTVAGGEKDYGDDGVDLGIVTSSSIAMTLNHVFSGVAGGVNQSVKTDAAKGSNKTLTMKAVSGAILVDATDGSTTVCQTTYDAGDITDEPAGCFRLLGPGAGGQSDAKNTPEGPDYLSGWSIELSPKGADVSWGRVNWEDDPFEDLTCGDADPIMVSDHVDICAMFEDEVDHAIGKGWTPTITFDGNNHVDQLTATAENSGGNGEMFTTLWFDSDLDGKMTDGGMDFYATTGTITMDLTDADHDPTVGDLGKVDLRHDADDDDTPNVDESEAGNPDGLADNYLTSDDIEASIRKCTEADGGDDDDGTICDATWMTDVDVAFADRTFGCTTTRSVSVTCNWDADGGMAVGRNELPSTFSTDDLAHFLKCTAK